MSFFKWMLIIFIAPLPVMLGILLSIPVIVIIGLAFIAVLSIKYLRNRFHPLRRKTPPPAYWL